MRYLSLLMAFCMAVPAQVAPMLNLVILEGEGATNNVRQRTAREPVVQVEDENHKPIAGAIVVFTLPSTGAGGTFANGAHVLSLVSDSKGQAVARGLRPNGLKGQFQIRVNASYQNQTATATITQTNALIAASGSSASSGVSGKLIAVLVAVGAAAAGGIYYATHNGGNGTPTAVIPPGTTITTGTGSVGPPR